MAQIDFQNVILVLRDKLKLVPGLPDQSKWQYHNVPFTQPNKDIWLREVFAISGESVAASAITRGIGIYLVQIFVPRGRASKDGRDMTKAIAEEFGAPSNHSGHGVNVCVYRTSRNELPDLEDYAAFNIEVYWRVYKSN